MELFENYKKKMTMLDHSLVKLSCVAFGIFLVMWIPALMNLDKWWWLVIALVLAIKPWYVAYGK